MRKLKHLTLNYLEDNTPIRETMKVESLTKEAQSALSDFLKIYKQERISEHKIELKITPPKNPPLYDVICPVYWINDYFEENVQNWFNEIPIRKLILGVNNPNMELRAYNPKIEIIDQTKHKTLGYCLAELMKQVKSEWFVFVHADAVVCSGLFYKLAQLIEDNVGCIEADRWEWDGTKYHDRQYHKIERAYSGVQLMRTKVFTELIYRIEDDYIYRNEDLIFQAECIKQGYKYIKSPERHLHQILNSNWTSNWDKTHDIQWRGLVKYTNPTPLTMSSCFPVLKERKDTAGLTLSQCMFFGYETNPNWNKPIRDEWERWGTTFDKQRGY